MIEKQTKFKKHFAAQITGIPGITRALVSM
jgi:hypothetical protein